MAGKVSRIPIYEDQKRPPHTAPASGYPLDSPLSSLPTPAKSIKKRKTASRQSSRGKSSASSELQLCTTVEDKKRWDFTIPDTSSEANTDDVRRYLTNPPSTDGERALAAICAVEKWTEKRDLALLWMQEAHDALQEASLEATMLTQLMGVGEAGFEELPESEHKQQVVYWLDIIKTQHAAVAEYHDLFLQHDELVREGQRVIDECFDDDFHGRLMAQFDRELAARGSSAGKRGSSDGGEAAAQQDDLAAAFKTSTTSRQATFKSKVVFIQAIYRGYQARRRRKLIAAYRRSRRLEMGAYCIYWWRMWTRAAQQWNIRMERKCFDAILGQTNITNMRKHMAILKIGKVRQACTVWRLFQMWRRYAKYIQAEVDPDSQMRLITFEDRFPLWDDFVEWDAEQRRIRVKAVDAFGGLAVDEDVMKLRIMRRWHDYARSRIVKRDKKLLALAHREFVLQRKYFGYWVDTSITAAQTQASGKAVKQYYMNKWKMHVMNCKIERAKLEALRPVSMLTSWVKWRKKLLTLQRNRTCAELMVVEHMPLALHVLYSWLGNMPIERAFMNCWRQWRAHTTRRLQWKSYVAHYWRERRMQLLRVTILAWHKVVAAARHEKYVKLPKHYHLAQFPKAEEIIDDWCDCKKSRDMAVYSQRIHYCSILLEGFDHPTNPREYLTRQEIDAKKGKKLKVKVQPDNVFSREVPVATMDDIKSEKALVKEGYRSWLRCTGGMADWSLRHRAGVLMVHYHVRQKFAREPEYPNGKELAMWNVLTTISVGNPFYNSKKYDISISSIDQYIKDKHDIIFLRNMKKGLRDKRILRKVESKISALKLHNINKGFSCYAPEQGSMAYSPFRFFLEQYHYMLQQEVKKREAAHAAASSQQKNPRKGASAPDPSALLPVKGKVAVRTTPPPKKRWLRFLLRLYLKDIVTVESYQAIDTRRVMYLRVARAITAAQMARVFLRHQQLSEESKNRERTADRVNVQEMRDLEPSALEERFRTVTEMHDKSAIHYKLLSGLKPFSMLNFLGFNPGLIKGGSNVAGAVQMRRVQDRVEQMKQQMEAAAAAAKKGLTKRRRRSAESRAAVALERKLHLMTDDEGRVLRRAWTYSNLKLCEAEPEDLPQLSRKQSMIAAGANANGDEASAQAAAAEEGGTKPGQPAGDQDDDDDEVEEEEEEKPEEEDLANSGKYMSPMQKMKNAARVAEAKKMFEKKKQEEIAKKEEEERQRQAVEDAVKNAPGEEEEARRKIFKEEVRLRRGFEKSLTDEATKIEARLAMQARRKNKQPSFLTNSSVLRSSSSVGTPGTGSPQAVSPTGMPRFGKAREDLSPKRVKPGRKLPSSASGDAQSPRGATGSQPQSARTTGRDSIASVESLRTQGSDDGQNRSRRNSQHRDSIEEYAHMLRQAGEIDPEERERQRILRQRVESSGALVDSSDSDDTPDAYTGSFATNETFTFAGKAKTPQGRVALPSVGGPNAAGGLGAGRRATTQRFPVSTPGARGLEGTPTSGNPFALDEEFFGGGGGGEHKPKVVRLGKDEQNDLISKLLKLPSRAEKERPVGKRKRFGFGHAIQEGAFGSGQKGITKRSIPRLWDTGDRIGAIPAMEVLLEITARYSICINEFNKETLQSVKDSMTSLMEDGDRQKALAAVMQLETEAEERVDRLALVGQRDKPAHTDRDADAVSKKSKIIERPWRVHSASREAVGSGAQVPLRNTKKPVGTRGHTAPTMPDVNDSMMRVKTPIEAILVHPPAVAKPMTHSTADYGTPQRRFTTPGPADGHVIPRDAVLRNVLQTPNLQEGEDIFHFMQSTEDLLLGRPASPGGEKGAGRSGKMSAKRTTAARKPLYETPPKPEPRRASDKPKPAPKSFDNRIRQPPPPKPPTPPPEVPEEEQQLTDWRLWIDARKRELASTTARADAVDVVQCQIRLLERQRDKLRASAAVATADGAAALRVVERKLEDVRNISLIGERLQTDSRKAKAQLSSALVAQATTVPLQPRPVTTLSPTKLSNEGGSAEAPRALLTTNPLSDTERAQLVEFMVHNPSMKV